MDGGDAQWGMTDLEERLRGHAGAIERRELLSRLSQATHRLDAMVALGLRPEDFERAKAMSTAVDTARQILTALSS